MGTGGNWPNGAVDVSTLRSVIVSTWARSCEYEWSFCRAAGVGGIWNVYSRRWPRTSVVVAVPLCRSNVADSCDGVPHVCVFTLSRGLRPPWPNVTRAEPEGASFGA